MPRLRWPRRKDWDPVELGHLILRDHLAAERTYLANERTLLAYIRTALALIAGGVTLLHFFDFFAADVSGVVLVILGLIAFAFGTRRFFRVHRRVGTYYRRTLQNAAAAVVEAAKEAEAPALEEPAEVTEAQVLEAQVLEASEADEGGRGKREKG